MNMHTATVEVANRIDPHKVEPGEFDDIMEQLADHHASVSVSARGWLTVTVTFPAETLTQAMVTAAAVVEAATGCAAIAAEVMPEAEYDARQGWTSLPELVSVTEAAQLLGVTRQAVLDRVRRHTLPATKIGRDYAIPREAITPVGADRQTEPA